MNADWALERARELAGEFVSVVNLVCQVTETGSILVFEWIAIAELYDEAWPVPAAAICHLGPEGELLSRRDFGMWLKTGD